MKKNIAWLKSIAVITVLGIGLAGCGSAPQFCRSDHV